MVSTLMVAYLEQAGLVIILMVVYLEQGGQSGSSRCCTWREKDGLYPGGGLPGASRAGHNPYGGISGTRRPVWITEVVYLEGEGWSLP
jgi:hypothetical protein